MNNSKVRLLSRIFFLLFGITLSAHSAFALTSITTSGVNGSGFPVALSVAGETYVLTENINCPTTCFSVKASNITIDLNGKKATFGTAHFSEVLNREMELWDNAGGLSNWIVQSGTVTQKPAQVWGQYDAELSATAVLRSAPFSLTAGQTYIYYAIIRGSSSDSYKLSLMSAADNSILASATVSGAVLNRGFAVGDGSIAARENEYKPSTNISAYLLIEGIGTASKRLHIADIKPGRHYFVVGSNYRNDVRYPDLPDSLFGGTTSGLVIKNGSIEQGAGQAVKGVAVNVLSLSSLSHVNIRMSGNNTGAMFEPSGSFVIDSVNFDTSSMLNLNRMHFPATVSFGSAASGLIEIKNSTFLNDPESAIRGGNSFATESDTHRTLIHNNLFRNKEQVTEGYAIAITGGVNVEIYQNEFNPFRGRGILLDSVVNRSGYMDGTKNVTIRNNTFRNIHEYVTPEYGQTALEAAAIRIRDWGGVNPPEGHRNLNIHDNVIDVYVDAEGSHRSYAINITSTSALTRAQIYNNRISARLVSQSSSDWEATCFALQNADMSGGGSIVIRNNLCEGDTGVRFGGNDGARVKNVELRNNVFNTTRRAIYYSGFGGPYENNRLYCNKINNVGSAGLPMVFENSNSVFSQQYLSHNLISNLNAGGYEAYLVKDLSTSVFSCENGTIDISGGGRLGGITSGTCTYGLPGCYSESGPQDGDSIAPGAPGNLRISD